MAMIEAAIKIARRQRLGVLTNFILLGEIRGVGLAQNLFVILGGVM